jgi:hypothetical protein
MHSFQPSAQRLQIQPQVQQTIRLQDLQHLQQIGPQSQPPVGHQLIHQQQQNSSNFLNTILSNSGQNQHPIRTLMQVQQQQQAPVVQQQQQPPQHPQTQAVTAPHTPLQVQPFYQQPVLQQQQPNSQPMQTQPMVQTGAAPPQLSFEESASDPYLSSILDDFISMQQEMNLDLPTNTARNRQTPAPQQSEDVMLLRILEEVIEPSAPNVATPTTPAPPVDLNERMAINAIQKQLMSFEVTTPTTPNAMGSPFQSVQPAPSYQQIPPPAYTATGYVQTMSNNGQQVWYN